MTMSGERGVEKAERFPWEYKSAHRSAVRYSLSSIFYRFFSWGKFDPPNWEIS